MTLSPALALSWQVWWRYRWGLAACAAAWAVLAGLGLLLPRGAWAPAAPADEPVFPVALVVLGTSMTALLFVAYVFSWTVDARLEAAETGFTVRLFTLPVPTPALVGWPMLQGTAAVAVTWLAWAGAVLRPAGLDVALWWPALLTAALLACLQALVWWPFPLRFLRVAATALVVLTAVGMTPVFCMVLEVPTAAWVGVLAALLPAAYAVAVAGVARTRRGDAVPWTGPSRLAQALAARWPRRGAAFPSGVGAQTWLEWRLHGMGYPFAVGLAAAGWGLLVVTGWGEHALDTLASSGEAPAVAAAVGALTAPGLLLAMLLAVPPLLGAVSATEMGGVRFVGQRMTGVTYGCHPFVAVRPLTDGELVLAKLRMAARATLTGWAVALLAAALCLGLTGGGALAGAPPLRPYSALAACGGAVAGLAGLVLRTWLQMVGGMWISLAGRPWLIHATGASTFLAWVPLGLLGYWLSWHPDVVAALVAALPYLAAGVAVVKLFLAGWLTRALRRRRLVRPRGLAVSATLWAVAAAGTLTLVRGLVPPDLASLPVLAVGVVLALPLNRFALAPLALEWNRHR